MIVDNENNFLLEQLKMVALKKQMAFTGVDDA